MNCYLALACSTLISKKLWRRNLKNCRNKFIYKTEIGVTDEGSKLIVTKGGKDRER